MVQLLGIFSFLVVLLRAAIMCAQSICVGGVIFLLLAARGELPDLEDIRRRAWRLIRWSALALGAAQLFFLLSNSFMLTASADITFRDVLGADFVLAGILAIGAALVMVFWPTQTGARMTPILLVPAGLMVAASVMTSHSASRIEGRALLVGLTALHYLAVAAWIGGLPYLVMAMKRIVDGGARARVGQTFSRMAQVSVAILFVAGLWLSYVYVGSWDATYGTAYGVMILTKVALFGCLLLLGAGNYYVVHKLGTESAAATSSVIHFGEVEIGIGLTVILAAASLTSQPPAADLTQDRVTRQEIATRFAPRMPRLTGPDVKELSEPSKQMVKRAAETGHSLPPAYVPGQAVWHPDKPSDLAWSEYNHNWAGLIVFVMAILALLSRSRYFAWAKIWPLSFLGLAVFLFLRADPENWPLGPNGFWESFGEADVLQHRAAVVLLILFAVFQWMVENERLKSQFAALVFPFVCAVGGVVLLTHTHALGNIKEEMLTELSHTPLAIFGIVAGWSRWLELRLPAENQTKRYLAWVWPVCFMFVGLILLNYHET